MIRLVIFSVLQLVLGMENKKNFYDPLFRESFNGAPYRPQEEPHPGSNMVLSAQGQVVNIYPPASGSFDRSIQGNQIICDQWNTPGGP